MSQKSLSSNDILEIFKKTGALLTGHFRLTSGLHSPSYFQCALVLQYPEYATVLTAKIVDHFKDKQIDFVVSPAIGGIVVGQEVGRQLSVRTIFAERKNGIMKFRRGFTIKPGQRALVCEDVITTGGSVVEVINLLRFENAQVAGVGCIVDRSNGKTDFGVDLYSVIQMTAETYLPEECGQCKEGTEIMKPGSR